MLGTKKSIEGSGVWSRRVYPAPTRQDRRARVISVGISRFRVRVHFRVSVRFRSEFTGIQVFFYRFRVLLANRQTERRKMIQIMSLMVKWTDLSIWMNHNGNKLSDDGFGCFGGPAITSNIQDIPQRHRCWKNCIFKLPQLTPLSSEPYGHQSLSSIHQTKPDTSNL